MYDEESLMLAYSMVHLLDAAIPCEVATNLTVMPDYGAIKVADICSDMRRDWAWVYYTLEER